MAKRYRLKQRWEKTGVLLRGVTGVINKDNFNESIARKICALGLASKFLEPVGEEKAQENASEPVLEAEAYDLSVPQENVPQTPVNEEKGEEKVVTPRKRRKKKTDTD